MKNCCSPNPAAGKHICLDVVLEVVVSNTGHAKRDKDRFMMPVVGCSKHGESASHAMSSDDHALLCALWTLSEMRVYEGNESLKNFSKARVDLNIMNARV